MSPTNPLSTYRDDPAHQRQPLLDNLELEEDSDQDPFVTNFRRLPARERRLALALPLVVLFSVALTAFVFAPFTLAKLLHLNEPMQSPLQGWTTRATAHPSASSFEPDASKLVFGILRSTPVRQNALVAAFFDPDFAVDGNGRVLKLSEDDATALPALVNSAVADDMPTPGGFRNQWRISHSRTSMPIHWLKVVFGGQLREVSIYGYTPDSRELSKSVDGITELPERLQETFGVLEEGRLASGGEGTPNEELASRIATIIVDKS